jgi:predicted ribonuclease toxin of YeeF-YezG toxin-antitoxin module
MSNLLSRDKFIEMCEQNNIDIKQCLNDIDEILLINSLLKLDDCKKNKLCNLIKNAETIAKKEIA